jgi:hypothetical protein
MSKELKDLIAVGLKYGFDVSTMTEEQASRIVELTNELKGVYIKNK